MSESRNNLDELLAVLEKIRSEKYPEIPSDLIEGIVKKQYDLQDERLLAKSETSKLVAAFLETIKIESEGE